MNKFTDNLNMFTIGFIAGVLLAKIVSRDTPWIIINGVLLLLNIIIRVVTKHQ